MTAARKDDPGPLSIVPIDVGNTTVAIGRWVNGQMFDVERIATTDKAAIVEALERVRAKCENRQRQAIVIGSVVPAVTAWLRTHIEETLNLRAFVIGDNIPLPIVVALPDPGAVGVDRICSAAAAYDRTGHACTVVDIGSAVTIDLVDDDGVFQGGAILPGMRLQAGALADGTAALPLVEPTLPASVLGQDTTEAITSGLALGVVGAIRNIVESIATVNNHWAQLVVTGGDAPMLAPKLDFADNLVPDLCLMGIGLAYMRRVHEASGV